MEPGALDEREANSGPDERAKKRTNAGPDGATALPGQRANRGADQEARLAHQEDQRDELERSEFDRYVRHRVRAALVRAPRRARIVGAGKSLLR